MACRDCVWWRLYSRKVVKTWIRRIPIAEVSMCSWSPPGGVYPEAAGDFKSRPMYGSEGDDCTAFKERTGGE